MIQYVGIKGLSIQPKVDAPSSVQSQKKMYKSSSRGMIAISDMHTEHILNAYIKRYTSLLGAAMRNGKSFGEVRLIALNFDNFVADETLSNLLEELNKRKSK